MLQIKTGILREWRKETDKYNRYEATPYQALESLIQHYKLKPTDRVVDFGSGRGRVSFFLHNHFNVPITGVEMTISLLKNHKLARLHIDRKINI
ncbi:hypothetical protein AXY_22710 [Amphibacillus xylanus NBRC 15112]|uniref:Methyltransferase n=1 Tax=Amphibacillus xylanus (strain ATCC 51415 / DSM 6626 / JCM 7361 / LMG 17667 / NBRC 15112 / Ep01) TaxID=698758 RepID=K0J830_AMPXN|nr:hypothetical protein AXY_22710 [Amphibacillus xylanus NBRC 15112]